MKGNEWGVRGTEIKKEGIGSKEQTKISQNIKKERKKVGASKKRKKEFKSKKVKIEQGNRGESNRK